MQIITRLEEAVLITIWRLGNEAYGVPINRGILQWTGKAYSMGALYFTLEQLHRKGYVTKEPGQPTSERGGRRKIYYRLTDAGRQALDQARAYQESLWQGVPRFAEGSQGHGTL